jgi:hypothetical protein
LGLVVGLGLDPDSASRCVLSKFSNHAVPPTPYSFNTGAPLPVPKPYTPKLLDVVAGETTAEPEAIAAPDKYAVEPTVPRLSEFQNTFSSSDALLGVGIVAVFVSLTVRVLPLDTKVTLAARLPDEPENETVPADAARIPNPIAANTANANTEERVIT